MRSSVAASAGLSAAHELAERGFEVTVYEAQPDLGGKARSMPSGWGTAAAPTCPPSTAFASSPASIATCPTRCAASPSGAARRGGRQPRRGDARPAWRRRRAATSSSVPARAPRTLDDLTALNRFLRDWSADVGIPLVEQAGVLRAPADASDELRRAPHRAVGAASSWWDSSSAEERSEAYGKFLADGLTRSLVAARAREMSARTGGYILLQLLFDLTRHGGAADRVLNAPANDAWIAPVGRAPRTASA